MQPIKFSSRRILIAAFAGIGFLAAAPVALAQPQHQGTETSVEAAFYIGSNRVNVRVGPGTSHNVAEVYNPGREVHVYERRGDWGRISKPNEPERWVYMSLLTQDSPRPNSAAQPTQNNTPAPSNTSGANNTSGPNNNSGHSNNSNANTPGQNNASGHNNSSPNTPPNHNQN